MNNLTFEEAIENLEKIVEELENGKLSLDESVKKFKNGIELAKYCNQTLEQAEKQISILLEDENGEIIEENFETKE